MQTPSDSPASEVQRELRSLLDENNRLRQEAIVARAERDSAYEDGYDVGYNDGAADC